MKNNTPHTIVNITKSAIKKIQHITSKEKTPKNFRIYIIGGGCNGFQYKFIMDKKTFKKDTLIKKKKSLSLLTL